MAHGETGKIKNPGPFVFHASVKSTLLVLMIVGVATFGGGLMADSKRAWASLVQNHFFFMSLALGGLFIAALNYITSAMWSAPIKRIYESFTSYLPFALLTFLAVAVGIHHIYEWSHPEFVKGDLVLEGKASYLSIGFFVIRNVVALCIWIFFAMKMLKNSVAQDANGDHRLTLKNKAMAPVFLIVFAITYTMASYDQMMSLDPHWFSTIFGVYCFSGLFYSTLALTAVMAIYLRRNGVLQGIVNDNHLHDLGKFMYAFSVFWAYIGFSQFMLIWYANMPEETGYFLHRLHGGWALMTYLLPLKFLVPFFLLLQRDSKRSESRLLGVGLFMLAAHWFDLMWVVQPEFFKEGPQFGWIEIGTTIGFIGLFGTCVVRFMGKHNIVAIGDPRLPEAVFHHHQ